MKKKTVKILTASLLSALAFTTAAGLFSAVPTVAANAEVQTDSLVVPQSYEEYLKLDKPSDVAVSENFFAVSDGNQIYIYDRLTEKYCAYTHAYNNDFSLNNVSKLQFDKAENLYFLDQRTLFVLENEKLDEAETETATATEFSCSTFLLQDGILYFTDVKSQTSPLYKTTLSDTLLPDKQNIQTIVNEQLKNATLAYWNDELYFTNKSLTTDLYKFDPSQNGELNFTEMQIASFDWDIHSMTVSNGILAFSTNAKEFYAYALPRAEEDTLLFYEEGAYTALTAFGEYIYAVNGNVVKQFSQENKAFTAYEICADSSAVNRLNGASESFLVGDKLFIADNGNARISVYDTKENSFKTPLNSTLSPSFMSADEKTLLTANEQKAVLYSLSADAYGAELFSFERFTGKVKGVAIVYGKYYVATEGYVYLLFKNAETGEWVISETEKTSFFPDLFTADVYGNLYTVQNNTVFRFTEEQLLDPDGSGTKKCTLSLPNVEKIAIDYEQNVYILSGNVIRRFGDGVTQTDFSAPLVYTADTKMTAFAFGIENNDTYLLFDGNYLVRSSRLKLPTVKNIATEYVDQRIFSTQSTEIEIVKTQKNALFVEFDLSSLQGATTFPYLSYNRSETEKTALKLDETEKYNLIAVFDEAENKYFTYLVLKSACEDLDPSVYRTTYETGKTAYLTNEVSLYKFPYLCELLTAARLPRGAEVKLLGEIGELDHEYYLISYTDENGETKTGYIPQSYGVPFDASPAQTEESTYGAAESDKDSVWRMAYLLLGFAAIGILVDYLILRKKKDD
ncbi:MAG: hypothetical protein IJX91_01115 [Clostridia bacterium]|nr:hypothetical protein [Clostridia bacterium]